MKAFVKSTLFKVLCGVAAFFIGMMIYAATSDSGSFLGAVVTPIQSGFSAITDAVGGFFDRLGGASSEAVQNEQLQEQINEYRARLVELEELRRQNEYYRRFLGLKEKNPDYRFAAARVIATDPSDLYGNFTINVGTLSEVKPGCAVITPEGLCGVVYEAGLNYAYVRTILDPTVRISAYDSRTREDGLTTGTIELARNGQMKLAHMDRDDTIMEGDYVVTYGGNYPEGLLIGEVRAVRPEADGLSKYAEVQPFADIRSVSDVLVITAFGETEATP